ncbi:helix-turn-helix domain-containing protein [Sporosarcina sp. Sa2YVA2]|uniref:Helix-turn-helix domain-containing protein n=1 Tax=Sporosarcina quadrami TaxID=2762234 RepID=A0ABR8U732_9BACL|nr:RodZ domain-containing protein [Sporosarcina quadrami]MBD7983595.1 helix-turn-helix domain-containing protein [Sporosarcina quadrami]
MTGLGDRLKEARTKKGYSLDDLQSITKIQKRYLSGIENEDYSMMPGSFYVRAFIKQYSEAVGLDADEMLALYKESSKNSLVEEDSTQIVPPMTRRSGLKNNPRLNETIPKIIVALFIIVIIVVAWVLWQQSSSSNKSMKDVETEPALTMDNNQPSKGLPVEPEEDTNVDDEETQPDSEPDEEVKKQVLTFENSSGEDSFYSLTEAEEFKLRIVIAGETWIAVTDENKKERTEKATVYNAGDTMDINVSDVEFVRIRVGRTYNTEIYVNEEKLEYSSDKTTQNIIIKYEK